MINTLMTKWHKLNRFQPKEIIYVESGSYILKTATIASELLSAYQLRYDVFYRELLGKKGLGNFSLDIDQFDEGCDHLVIIDKLSSKVIGTYRLNLSRFQQGYYSSQEFNLRRVLEQPGLKLELGRACIHKDHRRGAVISLLWRGIAQYMFQVEADLLFGCATINTANPRQAALLYQYFFEQGHIQAKFLAPPTKKYTMPELATWLSVFNRELSAEETSEAESLIPSLLKSYLKAGASIGGEPAYDAEFNCIDFLTVLPRENLNKSLWRKYQGWTPNQQHLTEIKRNPVAASSHETPPSSITPSWSF